MAKSVPGKMNANSLLVLRRTAMLVALVLAATSGLGCSRTTSDEPPALKVPEPSLAEQVQAVRDGQSNQIRLGNTLVVDNDLRQLEGLEDKLLRINFSQTEITDDGLARISRLPRLEQLRLASPRVDDAGLPCLGELKHLRFLHLIDMPITDAGLDHLHPLTSLESLYLDGTQATDEGIGRLVAALPKVHLHIDHEHHRLDPHRADHEHPGEEP